MNIFESKRLKRAKDKDKVFEFLDARFKESGFFSAYYEIYIFALSLGVKKSKKSKLVGAMSDPIHLSHFTDDHRKYMDMIILYASDGDINKIDKSNEENVKEMLKIIEEYANGGLEIILNAIESHPENSFELILLLLKDEFLKNNIPDVAKKDNELW